VVEVDAVGQMSQRLLRDSSVVEGDSRRDQRPVVYNRHEGKIPLLILNYFHFN
jgi:hypothetical protein